MRLKTILRWLLAVLAISGLLAVPAAAGRMTVESKGTHAAMRHMESMPDGMPCCPHEKQSCPDCEKNCPFAALCAAHFVAAMPVAASFLFRRLALAEPLFPYNDQLRDQPSVAPPRRPPRI